MDDENFEYIGEDAILFYDTVDDLNATVFIGDADGAMIILLEGIPERVAQRLIKDVASDFYYVEKKWLGVEDE